MLLLYDSRFLTARKEFCTPSSVLPAVFRANSLLKSTLWIWAPDCHSMSSESHVAQKDITTHTQHNTVLTDISTVTVLSRTGNGYHTTDKPSAVWNLSSGGKHILSGVFPTSGSSTPPTSQHCAWAQNQLPQPFQKSGVPAAVGTTSSELLRLWDHTAHLK